jgi:hypothetical protein
MSADDLSEPTTTRDYFLRYEHVETVLAAVKEADADATAAFTDWDGLLHELQSAYDNFRLWKNIEESPTDVQLRKDAEEMAAAAKKLSQLLKKHLSDADGGHHLLKSLEVEAYSLLWSRQPLAISNGKEYLQNLSEDLCVLEEITGRVRTKAAKAELRWLPRRPFGSGGASASAVLIARALPAIFKYFFKKDFKIQRRRDDTLHGPSLRFAQAALSIMGVKDADGKDFSPAAIQQTYRRYKRRGDKVPRKT